MGRPHLTTDHHETQQRPTHQQPFAGRSPDTIPDSSEPGSGTTHTNPHRTGPVPGDLITVTDPATGRAWRFIPDHTTPRTGVAAARPLPGLHRPDPRLPRRDRGANARVGKGGWSGITLGHLALDVIAEPEHDEHGLHVKFTSFLHALDVPGRYLCPSLMEALRLSANQWGRPVIAPAWPTLGVLARFIEHHPDAPEPDTPVHGELVTLLSDRATASAHEGEEASTRAEKTTT